MTKEQLQQELLEKVKLGTKPSQLKKSRSLSDIPQASLPKNLTKSKSAEELKPVKSPEIEQLETKISVLELKLETNQRELSELNSLTAENKHLKEQVKIKQQSLEDLRKELEEKSSQLVQVQTELDNSLQARQQSLKVFGSEYAKRKQAQSELDNTVEESSNELINSDQVIRNLRTQITKLQRETKSLEAQKQSLTKDLTLSQRLVELRRENSFKANDFNSSLNYFKYAVYGLLAVWFLLILRRNYDL